MSNLDPPGPGTPKVTPLTSSIPVKRPGAELVSGAMGSLSRPQKSGPVPEETPDPPNSMVGRKRTHAATKSFLEGLSSTSALPATIVDIRAKTEDEEFLWASHEVELMSRWERVTTGGSMRGKNIGAISKEISDSEGFPYAVTLAIEFTNLLDVWLTDPKGNLDFGASGEVPSLVPPSSKECLTFHDDKHPEDGVSGLITYRIDRTKLRLAIAFDVESNGGTFVGAAFMPADANFSYDGKLVEYIWNVVEAEKRSDIKTLRFSPGSKCLIVKLEDFWARVTIRPGPRAVIEVTVVKTPFYVRADLEEQLKEMVLQEPNNFNLPSPFPSKRNVVEIVNMLKVCLSNPDHYLPTETSQRNVMPTTIPCLAHTSFPAFDLRCSEEIFSYRIDSTDLRLALTCSGDSFAIGFIPHHVPLDTELISSLKKPDQWVTRPDRKCGLAKDGELKIEKRNIRARATMTEGPNVMLKVVISTF